MSTAFVLSGGGSLGAVQVGMLRAFAERHVRPGPLVGTSAASDELAEIWTSLRRRDIFPLRPHSPDQVGRSG